MRVTSKGQVTIPQHIRERLGILPMSEVNFVLDEDGRVYIVKAASSFPATDRFARLRGVATVKMTTEEIMALTRSDT